MNKLFTKFASLSLGLTLAASAGAFFAIKSANSVEAVSTTVMSFDFEDETAHRTSGNNNYSSPNSYTENSVDINLNYADSVTSGTPLGGSANVLARVAKNTTNSPTITIGPMDLSICTVTGFTYMSKSVGSLTVASSYSTDGTNWTAAESHTGNSTAKSFDSGTLSIESPSAFYIKFVVSVTSGSSTTGNRDSQFDDIAISGEVTSSIPLDSISCNSQNISVASVVDLASAITYSPENATNKTLYYEVKTGSDYVEVGEDGKVTGIKGGNAVITVTPDDTTGDATAIDVDVEVVSLDPTGITAGEQYVIYTIDETNGNYEMTGLSSSVGTAASFDSDIPSCEYILDVEEGYFENTIALKNGTKYLSLNSAANNIHQATEVTKNASWIVTYDASTNAATITNAVFQNRGIQFNYNSGNSRFACYTVGGSMLPVRLYKFVDKPLVDFTIESSIEVYKTGTKAISVTYDPADSPDKELTWESADETIATVNSTGVVTGVAVGETTISASKVISGVNVTRECSVHVLNNASEHYGTLVDPFNIADAVNVAKGIFSEDPSGNSIDLTNSYYVSGKLTKYVNRTTSTLTFWLGDDDSQISAATGAFEVYKVATVYGTALATKYSSDKDVQEDFFVGNQIVVYSTLTVYGETAETTQNVADIVLNDFIEAKPFAEAFFSALTEGENPVCDSQGDTDLDVLGEAWAAQKTAFNSVSDSGKALFISIAEDGDEKGNKVEKCVALYDYIIKKYNTSSHTLFEDFMHRVENGKITLSSSTRTVVNNENVINTNSAIIAVIIISVFSISSIGVLLVVKKRKNHI